MADGGAITDGNATGDGYAGVMVTAQDGLRLFVRDYGPRRTSELPVVCLPGMARTSADFHELATALASDPATPRRVIAIDYRGRGRSQYDRDPARYAVAVELADLVAVITALEIAPALFVGTSRGGILVMMLATVRPTAIAGVVLNDVGPVIEAQGLMRIKNYVGKLPTPRSFEEGADILRRLGANQFPRLTADEWMLQARLTWKMAGQTLVPDYDPRLAKALESHDLERPLAPLWGPFDALARTPLMVLRGANSDLLSAKTFDAMRSHHLDIDVIEVPDQGHAPLLTEPDIIRRIAGFFATCDSSTRH
jgi:pimeloyl-ACP methyl ester carboxylesterase